MRRDLPRLALAAAGLLLMASAGFLGWRLAGAADEREHIALRHALASQPILIHGAGSGPDLTLTEADPTALPREHALPLPATVIGRVAPAEPGRPDRGLRHQWPGTYATARFAGDALILAFDDPFNRYRIALDDDPGPVLTLSRPHGRAWRLSGLGPGPHRVRVEKISESPGAAGFPRLLLPAGQEALPPPPPLARQIEVIGDSDSVGYGNLSDSRDCEGDGVFLLTDTQASYGPQVARRLGADYQLIAASGIGLVRNYGGANPDRSMATLYPRRLFDDPDPRVPEGWSPDLVLLALGSNDFASPPGPGEPWTDAEALRAEFEATYVRFLRDLRARHPEAFLLLVKWDQYGSDYAAAHEAVLAAMRAGGEARIDLLTLPDMERTACHWHPSLDDHRRTADGIIDYVESHPELWTK